MEKYIHYCWFGGKPLPKLAKKCIKSWKKYLPDYEIIEWNESNFDINYTSFSKDAYDNKKWAFVADVARVKALHEYGGIYLDTDMEITADVMELMQDEFFAGWESHDYVAVGVLGVKNKNNIIIKKMIDKYKEIKFNVNDLYQFSIPKVLTEILFNDYSLKKGSSSNQHLTEGIVIYSRDYFYPLSYDRKDNIFTENTKMIHYYDASWIPKGEKRINFLSKFMKRSTAASILDFLSLYKNRIKFTAIKIAKKILFPIFIYRRNNWNKKRLVLRKEKFLDDFSNVSNCDNIVFHNGDWLGTTFSTKELFENTCSLPELENADIEYIASAIGKTSTKIIVFSAFAIGWSELIKKLKMDNPNIIIKIIWHGSNSVHIEHYDFERFKEIFNLLESNMIESIGFVKKSMYDFFKQKGYNVEFIANTVVLPESKRKINKASGIKIGLYASGDRWVKNFYNQLAAASVFDDAIIDCIPISNKVIEFSKILKIEVNGIFNNISREDMIDRLSNNDINLYVTFTECAPLLPLESLEMGVPCITSKNHHYFENSILKDYLFVDSPDDAIEIARIMKKCLDNRDFIIKEYKKWKKEYDRYSKETVIDFLRFENEK